MYIISHPSNNLGVWTCQWIIDTGLPEVHLTLVAGLLPPSSQRTALQTGVLAAPRIPVLSTSIT